MQAIHSNVSESSLAEKNVYRDRIEQLGSRVSLLSGKDRLLMTMYLKNGNSFRQLAQLAGVSETNIARRIHKIIKRLTEGKYIACLRSRDKFTKSEMAVAKDYFLLGLSQNKITAKRNYSTYGLRKILKKIEQVVKTSDNF